MQQNLFQVHIPSDIYRPLCSKCGSRMWLLVIEPTDKPNFDTRSFECSPCENIETLTFKYQ